MLFVMTALCVVAAVVCFVRIEKAKYERHIWWYSGGVCLLIAALAFGSCAYVDYYLNHGPKRILCVDQTSKEVVSTVSKGGIVTHGSSSFEYLEQDGSSIVVIGLSCIITEP